ncbi:MAG TPA: hypothetical protein DEF42_19840 [Desulfosporosinus sp.]|nr:hypothetical protein [Desulfosporosinus sp.]
MDDAPSRIFLLCDADECAFNELLQEARSKATIKDLESEYENWITIYGKTIEIETTRKGIQNKFIGCQSGLIAYVDRNRIRFLPFSSNTSES